MKYQNKAKFFSLFLCMSLFLFESRFFPNGFRAVYSFESFISDGSTVSQSTSAILLPDALRKEGKYLCRNNSDYTIAIFTSTDGLLKIYPGEQLLHGRPVAMFLQKPETAILPGNQSFEISKSDSKLSRIFTICTTDRGVSAAVKQTLTYNLIRRD